MTMETLGGDASSGASSKSGATESPAHCGTTPGRLGEFRILREIGRGGMGVVYEAEQESLGRRVALKILPGNLLTDASQVRRFVREARSAARLHHTNIVPVFGVGQHDGTHFYAMQFIEGQGLDVILEELRQLRTARRTRPPGWTNSARRTRDATPPISPGHWSRAGSPPNATVTGRLAAAACSHPPA